MIFVYLNVEMIFWLRGIFSIFNVKCFLYPEYVMDNYFVCGLNGFPLKKISNIL